MGIDKGIRPATNALFVAMLPQRAELGNTGFRKTIMSQIMDDFGITLASAATHYNHAFKECKAANAALVEGLGRAEDKKGGRKPKAVTVETDVTDETPVETETVAEVVEDVKLYNVLKKKGDSLVLLGVTLEEATAAVEKAAKGKKAALYMV